ncbi:MAG: glycoside hydrolase family 2 protein [Eubacterium sp.]
MRYTQTINRWKFTLGDYSANVTIPHTWNVDDPVMKHRGEAEYETAVFIDDSLKDKKAFLKFNAVYHSARVYVNDAFAGCHSCSGYTPFKLEITDKVIFGADNNIKVVVDNTHIDEMLPRKDDFDWADDGGVIRRVSLDFIEPDGIEYMQISEDIESITGGRARGTLTIKTNVDKPCTVKIYDYSNGQLVIEHNDLTVPFENLKIWSCYSPNLYIVTLETDNDIFEERIGIRKIEVKGERVYLNDEEIYLKGCEWMPGSHPDFGMGEPLDHSIKCLRQLKSAGCIFTRFHWQQDDSIFDWCDENGILVQEEIPYWGYPKQATELQLNIAKQQADEMVYFHSNHPSIICWGVGNELGGETEATIKYVDDMVAYFKSLDSRRLVNYVSNSLSRIENVDKDDATLHGDIAMWNDYLGLWEPSDDIENHMIRTCKKAKGMPLLVSEFGLCEPHFKGGDEERTRILKERLEMYSRIDNICGYMWFSLNDYRTHCGEAGEDKMRQRVHGSTDLYGNKKPSYSLLRKLQG